MKQQFHTGAQRDTQDGKPRLDLLPWAELERVANHYERGAKHYGEFNWQKGIPSSRYLQSFLRHASAVAQGRTDEDHLSACCFNLFGIAYNQRVFADDPKINDVEGWVGEEEGPGAEEEGGE